MCIDIMCILYLCDSFGNFSDLDIFSGLTVVCFKYSVPLFTTAEFAAGFLFCYFGEHFAAFDIFKSDYLF